MLLNPNLSCIIMRTSLHNKVRVQVIEKVSEGHHQINTLTIKDPSIYQFSWELMVTNGLGYIPVREKMEEREVTDEVGLIRHLGNMDYTVLLGEYLLERDVLGEVGSELINLEREYNNGINCLINNIHNLVEQASKRRQEPIHLYE